MTAEQKKKNYAAVKRYRKRHRKKVLASNRAWAHRNRKKHWAQSLQRKFGISEADYVRLSALQKDLCAICNRPETSKCKGTIRKMAVDHCHTTGQVRALLCAACNRGVGFMGDSPERLRAAAAYVERFSNNSLAGL